MHILHFFFSKKARLKIRFISKGHKILKKTNQLDLLKRLNDLLTRTSLSNVSLSKTVQTNNLNFELSTRQYLYSKILDAPFNKAILYSIGSGKGLRYPLPMEWRNRLAEEGIKIDNLACSLLWIGYVFKSWVCNVIKGILIFFKILRGYKDLKKHVYFDQITTNSFPSNNKDHTIINWYLQWKNKIKKIDSIVHSDESVNDYNYEDLNIFLSDGLPQIKGYLRFKYILWSLYLYFYSLLFFANKPYSSLLLFEQLKLIRVKLSSKDDIAKDILFNNSSGFYRPLWTYEAEVKGARILFYFYSANIENFKTKNSYSTQNPWHLASWSYYLIWDDFQANFIKRNCKYSSVKEIVGPIWFSSIDKSIDVPSNSISVFDMTPFRPSEYFHIARNPEYNTFQTIEQFLNDILYVLSHNNLHMVHKMKRNTKRANKKYISKLGYLVNKSNYSEINPSVGALDVIKKTKACISLPFTSTALIAKAEGKPSVYYDPTGIISKDELAAHGVLVLSGISELGQWVQGLEK